MLHPNYVEFVFLQEFDANTDVDTVKEILFDITVTARVVRIWPLRCNVGYFAFRFDILGM